MAGQCLLALYYLLRPFTCAPPVVVSITRRPPYENLRFDGGLFVFPVALGLMVDGGYTALPRLVVTGSHFGIKTGRSMPVTAADELEGNLSRVRRLVRAAADSLSAVGSGGECSPWK